MSDGIEDDGNIDDSDDKDDEDEDEESSHIHQSTRSR